MKLLEKLLRRKEAKNVQEEKPVNVGFVTPRRQTYRETHPNGLSMAMLKIIDYEKFGTVLKQKNLLPPSYDRKPAEVDFSTANNGCVRVKLTFKSNTSDSYRVVAISGYNVSYGVNMPYTYDHSEQMSKEWEDFVERFYFLQERGYPSYLVNDARIKKWANEEKDL